VDCFTDYYDPALKRRNVETAQKHPKYRLLELDLGAAPLASLPEVDVVFHQAAQAGVRASWGAEFATYVHHNVLATQRLLERYRDTKLERFVYASSSSVYGDAERYPTDEALLPRPFSPYGVTKLAGEHLVLLYGRNFGLPVSALRYFTVYGPRQRPDMAFHRFCRSLLRGEEILVYGDGKQSRDFTFIDDAIEAKVRFEPRPPGDPLRTRADAARLQADLGYATRVGIADGLAAEAAWARTLYGTAA
jgi:UDP-glucose 4-epimerase